MAFMREWEKDLQGKEIKDLLKFQGAINTLIDGWEMFGKEYREIRVLKSLVDCELETRK
jgi:hypothetical protein